MAEEEGGAIFLGGKAPWVRPKNFWQEKKRKIAKLPGHRFSSRGRRYKKETVSPVKKKTVTEIGKEKDIGRREGMNSTKKERPSLGSDLKKWSHRNRKRMPSGKEKTMPEILDGLTSGTPGFFRKEGRGEALS